MFFSQEEKKILNDSLASGRSSHAKVLRDGMVLVMVGKKKELLEKVEADKLNEEVAILIMADLQERQTTEDNALMQALAQTVRYFLFKVISFQVLRNIFASRALYAIYISHACFVIAPSIADISTFFTFLRDKSVNIGSFSTATLLVFIPFIFLIGSRND